VNRRIIHIICGGHNTGKTTFAKYLQSGKKNIFRICTEELEFSTGFKEEHILLRSMLATLLPRGDIIIDDNRCHLKRERLLVNNVINRINRSAAVFCYVVKRPVADCFDDYYSEEEIEQSHTVEFPTLSEGYAKVISVSWSGSSEAVEYGEDAMMIKPELTIVEEIKDERPAVVEPVKKGGKRKLRRGRQDLFRPKPNVKRHDP
jgi:hypothetical protein